MAPPVKPKSPAKPTDPAVPGFEPIYTNNVNTKNAKGWRVKDPVVKPDTDPKQRVDLQIGDFDKLIQQKGINLRIYRSFYCPNVKSVDGAEHEIDCNLCNGSGFMDVDPITTKGFIQNQDLDRILDGAAGQHDGNMVSISFLSGIELQYFTRIELCDYTDLYYQRVMRKPGSFTDILKYKACRVNVLVDKNNVMYYQDQDFKLDANGNVRWITTGSGINEVKKRAPADEVIYSIHYETHVQYRAVKAMHVSRFTQYRASGSADIQFVKMSEQWMACKEFLLRRKDIQNGNDLLEGPFDTHENSTGNND
jgi:hypothetical protein